MFILEIFIIAVALSLDAFAVSIAKGLQIPHRDTKSACIVGLYFGFFQALMPLIGYVIGATLNTFIENYSPYISFAILAYLGANMIRSAIKNDDEGESQNAAHPLSFSLMLMAAIATSIDALAIGVVYRYNYTLPIFIGVVLIGLTTFCISYIGVKLGYLFNDNFRKKAEIIAGLVLIVLGVRFLF